MIEQARENYAYKGHMDAFTIQEIEEAVQSEASTDLVPVVPQEVSLDRATHTGMIFTSAARYEESAAEPRELGWRTGNNRCFAANGKTPLENAHGWFIDRPDEDEMFPDDYRLCEAMEILVEQGQAIECEVVYLDKDGKNPHNVPSWKLSIASLFVVCEGVPSKSEMGGDARCRWGVAYGWDPNGNRSRLRFHCFVKELMDAGYDGVFKVSLSGLITDRAIKALKAQDDVLKFVDTLRGEPLPYYAYAIPLGCSIKTMTAGSEKTSEVYYPIPLVPGLSRKNAEATIAYLDNVAISARQVSILENNGRVDQCIEWSVKESARILAGKDDESALLPPRELSSVDINVPF